MTSKLAQRSLCSPTRLAKHAVSNTRSGTNSQQSMEIRPLSAGSTVARMVVRICAKNSMSTTLRPFWHSLTSLAKKCVSSAQKSAIRKPCINGQSVAVGKHPRIIVRLSRELHSRAELSRKHQRSTDHKDSCEILKKSRTANHYG